MKRSVMRNLSVSKFITKNRMKKNIDVDGNELAQLRNLSEYAGALKLSREFKTRVMADESLQPECKLKMINAIDVALAHLSPAPELSDVTVGDVINKIENGIAI
jgi:hypothetical protein